LAQALSDSPLGWQAFLNPASEIETADDADNADKPKLGGETRLSSVKSVKSAVHISVFGLDQHSTVTINTQDLPPFHDPFQAGLK